MQKGKFRNASRLVSIAKFKKIILQVFTYFAVAFFSTNLPNQFKTAL